MTSQPGTQQLQTRQPGTGFEAIRWPGRRRLAGRLPVRDERGGSPAVEALLIVGAIVLLLSLATAGYRIAMAEAAVDGVASAAARAASIARTAGQARADAHQVADSSLSTAGLTCTSTDVDVNTAGFAVPVGQPASVTVSVTCQTPLQDLLIPGLGGSRTLTASSVSPLDTYRERQ
jgi:Flp pilus assembly protein TadG